jgi:hypothetical protein
MFISQAPVMISSAASPTGMTVRLPVLARDPPGGACSWLTGTKLWVALERLVLSGRDD